MSYAGHISNVYGQDVRLKIIPDYLKNEAGICGISRTKEITEKYPC